jgi:hypothetical protein
MGDVSPFPVRDGERPAAAPAWLAAFVAVVVAIRDVVKLALLLAAVAGVPMLAGYGLAVMLR